MSRTALLGTLVFAVAGLSGCASPVKVIDSNPNSVVVAIPDNTNSWPFYYQDEARKTATDMLQDPVLVSTQRVKVGSTLTNTQDTTRHDIGGSDNKPKVGEVTTSRNTTSVSDNYEYHLVYQKRPTNQVPDSIKSTVRTPAPVPTGPGDPATKPAGYSAPGLPPVPADEVRMPDARVPVYPPTPPATNLPPTVIRSPGP